ncbi:replication initiator [Actinopolymorpha sp. B17G11]|uniref:replication initiator n=1 Tax=Actinopolymorpha sp. B17G11 TaxID=3160861 RepID=UPI0032E438BF
MTASTSTLTPDTTVVSGAVADAETPIDLANVTGLDKFTATTTAMARGAQPDYPRWLRHVHGAAGCSQPVRLVGQLRTQTVDTSTGQITNEVATSTAGMPDGVIYKACGNRRASVCPSCAEIYRADAYQLVAAGLKGGKGVPETVGGHPAVFATLTAPGFGIVHTTRTTKKNKPAPCCARRTPDLCRHGVDLRCMRVHQDGDHRLGTPLCSECYDYDHHAIWNVHASELWRRTQMTAKRLLDRYARDHGHVPRVRNPATGRLRWGKTPVRISFGKCAEFQRRGLVHFHILARFDGINPNDPDDVIAPPAWANSFLLAWILRNAVEHTSFQTHGLVLVDHHGNQLVDQPEGWPMAWGSSQGIDIRPVRVRGSDPLTEERVADELDHTGRRRMLTGSAVAGYLAKYATKATEITGHTSRKITPSTVEFYANNTHPGRLIASCWRLGQRGLQTTTEWEDSGYHRLRRWAHMLGFGGHFFTKSRRYSTTFRQLRKARVDYRRAHHERAEHLEENEEIETIAELVYAGTGWHTTGDALLANTAAALAREHRYIGRLEIATTG